VKLYRHEGELYVLAKSSGRQAKENAMRRKRLARLLRRLRERVCPSAINCCCVSARQRRRRAAPSGS